MKRKKWLIPAVIAVVAVSLAVVVGLAARRSLDVSTGRYLAARNDVDMLVVGSTPIKMSDRGGRDLFDGLDTGDKILVLHDGIAESYPAQSGAYAVFRLGDGSVRDIPQRVIDELTEMGWMDAAAK